MDTEKRDMQFMGRCLELARKGAGYTAPNPMVGCILTAGEKIIAQGYHREFGGPHAEVNAIGAVPNGDWLSRSTLYVNLEPCAHFGKTPPCTDLILEKGIPRVVVGMPDPDLGEQICAYVKLVEGATLSHEDILQHLKTMEAARMHYPERTIFVSEIPLTAAGKADKKILKKDIESKLKSEAGKF